MQRSRWMHEPSRSMVDRFRRRARSPAAALFRRVFVISGLVFTLGTRNPGPVGPLQQRSTPRAVGLATSLHRTWTSAVKKIGDLPEYRSTRISSR